MRSGLGHDAARTHGRGPLGLVSDLGVFDYPHGRMRLVSFFPGVTAEHIQSKTGFALEIAPQAGAAEAPTAEELRLLREEIDPWGIRRLELLAGADRRQALRDILAAEAGSAGHEAMRSPTYHSPTRYFIPLFRLLCLLSLLAGSGFSGSLVTAQAPSAAAQQQAQELLDSSEPGGACWSIGAGHIHR